MGRSRSTRYVFVRLALLLLGVLIAVCPVQSQAPSQAATVGSQVFIPLISTGSGVPPVPAEGSPPISAPTEITLGTGSRLGVWMGGSSTVDLLEGTGAAWTHVNLSWSAIEPVETLPPTYHFNAYDSLLASIGGIGVTPVVEILGNPSWAAETGCGPVRKLDRYADFLRALVGRYKNPPYNVKHWELYNEPDNRSTTWGTFLGGCFGNFPDRYVQVLQTVTEAIKQVDPEAKIVFGGLAMGQYVDPTEGPIFNTDFFSQVLDRGGGAYFDVANIHYYSSQMPAFLAHGGDVAGKIAALRQVMSQHGVSKPVLITELGYTTSAENAPDFLEAQARYVPKALSRGLAANLYAMLWFSLSDWDGADYPYGLTNTSLQARPSYRAFQVAVAEFGQAASVRPLVPREVNVASGVEGYVFEVNGQERWILWANKDDDPVLVRLPGRAVEAHDKIGQPIQLSDYGIPSIILLDDSPIYVRLSPG